MEQSNHYFRNNFGNNHFMQRDPNSPVICLENVSSQGNAPSEPGVLRFIQEYQHELYQRIRSGGVPSTSIEDVSKRTILPYVVDLEIFPGTS